MKKNRMMRLAAILAICVLLSTSVISGTFAKYVSTASGSDTARVAKWEITYADGANAGVDVTEADTVVFDLFSTVNEADTITAETHVAKDNNTAIIAPGTGGSFKMKVENKSEVTAKYTIALTETNANNIFIQYSLDGNTWSDDVASLNTAMANVALSMDGSVETTVYWRWAFEGGNGAHAGQTDTADTALGVAAQEDSVTVTMAAQITVEQVD